MIIDEKEMQKFISESVSQESLKKWSDAFENGNLDFYDTGYKVCFLNSLALKYSELVAEGDAINVLCRTNKNAYCPVYYYLYALHVYENDLAKSFYFEDNVIKGIYVNLGNEYMRQFRLFEALECYNKAICIDPNFGLAYFNRALCKEKFSNARFYFNVYACFNEISNDLKQDMGFTEDEELAHNEYVLKYKNIGEKLIIKNPSLLQCKFGLYKSPHYCFSHWALINGLFLNPINSFGYYRQAKIDKILDLGLPLEQKEQLAEIFEYYIFLREKLFVIRDGDNDKQIRESLEIFKGLYSIFDKIAFVIAKAFKLNMNEDVVNFRNIWKNSLGLLEIKNVYLYELYWLQQEYCPRKKSGTSDINVNRLLAPEYREYVDLRNRIEHKVEKFCNMEFEKIYKKTLSLMKVIRIAILNLNWLLYDEQTPALYDSNGKRNKNMVFLPEILWPIDAN